MIGTTARLVIDLRETIAELQHGNSHASCGIHVNPNQAVGPTPQEQVASLAPNVRNR